MRDGKVSGVVSAGNTGAVMATAKMVVGTLPVVDRPALSTVLPTQKGKPAFFSTSAPTWIASRCTWSNSRSWATSIRARYSESAGRAWDLLSIGEEDSKGNELTKERSSL